MRTLAFTTALAAAFTLSTSVTRAHTLDVPWMWYATRTLAEQVAWDRPAGETDLALMQASYLLAELSDRAYMDKVGERNVAELGFEETRFVSVSKKLETSDAGAVFAISTQLPKAILGDRSIAGITPSAKAVVVRPRGSAARVVAVRGTSDFDDALLDANTATVSVNGTLYHYGFYIYSALLYDQVRGALGDCTDPVWLTGHSLGGASASVLALWLKQNGCNVKGVVTFGAPAAGRSNFADAYSDAHLDGVTHRWANLKDIVVCTPLGPNWARVGTQHLVTGSGLRLRDGSNVCDGLGEGYEASAYGYFMKAHDALDITPEVTDWIKSGLESAGMCHNENLAKRIVLGILSGGASELTCKSIDDISDWMTTATQIQELNTVLLAGKTVDAHKMERYLLRLVDSSQSADDPYCQPIWRPRMEQLTGTSCP